MSMAPKNSSTKALGLLTLALLAMMALALGQGLPEVGLMQVLQAFTQMWGQGGEPSPKILQIALDLRLPRVIMGVLAGAGLALAGMGAQAVLLNPLVCPSVLGISSGAAFGASLSIMYGPALFGSTLAALGLSSLLGQGLTMIMALVMALLAAMFSYFMASLRRQSRETVILAGIAVNYLFAGGIVLLQYLADWQDLRAIIFWTIGSLWSARWDQVWLCLAVLLPCTLAMLTLCSRLNALTLGEDSAQGLGISVARLRLLTLVLCSVASAIVVACTGAIGFVGLMAPHIARSLVGLNHRLLMPASMLIGALLLLFADTASRVVLWPQELPVGVMTSLVGGPFFLFLLLRRKKDWWV